MITLPNEKQESNIEDIAAFLYSIRNNYTHNGIRVIAPRGTRVVTSPRKWYLAKFQFKQDFHRNPRESMKSKKKEDLEGKCMSIPRDFDLVETVVNVAKDAVRKNITDYLNKYNGLSKK